MQLTDHNWFTRSLVGGYKMMNGSRVHKLFFKNGRRSNQEIIARGREQYVDRNSQSMSTSRMAMAKDSTNSMRSSAMSNVFIVLFTFLAQSNPCSHYIGVLALTISPRPLQMFLQCTSYWESRQILSRRQHALNNNVCLITWFYGTYLESSPVVSYYKMLYYLLRTIQTYVLNMHIVHMHHLFNFCCTSFCN